MQTTHMRQRDIEINRSLGWAVAAAGSIDSLAHWLTSSSTRGMLMLCDTFTLSMRITLQHKYVMYVCLSSFSNNKNKTTTIRYSCCASTRYDTRQLLIASFIFNWLLLTLKVTIFFFWFKICYIIFQIQLKYLSCTCTREME